MWSHEGHGSRTAWRIRKSHFFHSRHRLLPDILLALVAAFLISRPTLTASQDVRLKNEWEFCSASAECASNCCSNELANDGSYKCHPRWTKNCLPAPEFEVIAQLTDPWGPSAPNANLLAVGDALYGTSMYGGQDSAGTVFKVSISISKGKAAAVTLLRSFGRGEGGQYPLGRLSYVDGSLVGTCESGSSATGRNHYGGSLWKMSPAGTNFKQMASWEFPGSPSDQGGFPQSGVIQLANGDLVGTTLVGGRAESGTVYRYRAGDNATTTIAHFGVEGLGKGPHGELVVTEDGTLYGTTSAGGVLGKGTIFKITPSGVISTAAEFGAEDGSSPGAALTLGPDGAYYGTTSEGGSSNVGTLFRFDPINKTLRTFAQFKASVCSTPGTWAPLLFRNGAILGTCERGGANDKGSVFRAHVDGTVDLLWSFSGEDGMAPSSGLTEFQGKAYGVTSIGGYRNAGVVYAITFESVV